MSAALQARIEELEEEVAFLKVGLGSGVILPPQWRLSPTESVIVACIYKRQLAAPEVLMNAIYASRGRDAASAVAVRALIRRARLRLRRHGHAITTRWGFGYELAPETRAAIESINQEGAVCHA